MAAEEESKLTRAEKFLEDDAILFEEFLKENDKNSVEAIKMYQFWNIIKKVFKKKSCHYNCVATLKYNAWINVLILKN